VFCTKAQALETISKEFLQPISESNPKRPKAAVILGHNLGPVAVPNLSTSNSVKLLIIQSCEIGRYSITMRFSISRKEMYEGAIVYKV
jgi:hypothetical protein